MTDPQVDAPALDEQTDAAAAPEAPEALEALAAPAPAPAPAPAVAVAAGPHYLSIVAFAVGLAGLLSPGLPSIAAIILGHIGLAKEPTGRTYAIIGLVSGYLVVGMTLIGVIVFFSMFGVILSSVLAMLPVGEFVVTR